MKTIVGLFDRFDQAQSAMQELERAGIPHNDISLIANNATGEYNQYVNRDTTTTTTTAPAEGMTGAGAGATTGAVVGGVAGLLMGLGVFAIPGFGPIVAAGWLVSTITGAGIGALAGGLIGALTDIGVPAEEASYYNEGVRRGGTLLAVKAEDNLANSVAQILDDNGAVDIDQRGATYRQEGFLPTPTTPMTQPTTTAAMPSTMASRGATGAEPIAANTTANTSMSPNMTNRVVNAGEQVAVPVVEETLEVGKRQEQRGGVRIYSHVTQKPVEESVQLREEHVTVDRHPVNRPISTADMAAFKEGTIEVTETAEVPVVNKEARVVEEVVVGKEATQRMETVRDTVQRTDVQVEQLGREHTSRTADWSNYETNFRKHWTTNYGNRGGTYEQYAPAYQYGYDMVSDPRYRGRNWADIEPNLRRDWETRQPGTWDQFKNSVRYAWDSAMGNGIPGIQTGGRDIDGTPDTRGITEKVADTLTGDRIDDKTGKPIA